MSYRPKLTSASIEFLAKTRTEDDSLWMELQYAQSPDDYINTLIAYLEEATIARVEYSVALRPEPAPPKNPPREVFKYGRAGRRA